MCHCRNFGIHEFGHTQKCLVEVNAPMMFLCRCIFLARSLLRYLLANELQFLQTSDLCDAILHKSACIPYLCLDIQGQV